MQRTAIQGGRVVLAMVGLSAIAAVGGCGSCAGSPGTLVAARADASFVTEPSAIYVKTQAGVERVSLDGRARRIVFAESPRHWHVQAISPDDKTWALGTDDTELFVGDSATGSVRKVDVVGNRASAVAFSPDGKRLALGRHSDFSKQGSKDDDTLYIVEVATLAATTLAPSTDHWPATITWSADGTALFVKMNHSAPSQWVTLGEGASARRETASEPRAALDPSRATHDSIECAGRRVAADRWEPSVRVWDAADAGIPVARLEGRKRGFHDYLPDFSEASFSPGCGYVVFAYRNGVWVAPVDGRGGPGPIVADGHRVAFAR